MTQKIDNEMLTAIVLEIGDRFKLLIKLFPINEETEHLLKNLAASSIHLALFMKDYTSHSKTRTKDENLFLEECGCKDLNN